MSSNSFFGTSGLESVDDLLDESFLGVEDSGEGDTSIFFDPPPSSPIEKQSTTKTFKPKEEEIKVPEPNLSNVGDEVGTPDLLTDFDDLLLKQEESSIKELEEIRMIEDDESDDVDINELMSFIEEEERFETVSSQPSVNVSEDLSNIDHLSQHDSYSTREEAEVVREERQTSMEHNIIQPTVVPPTPSTNDNVSDVYINTTSVQEELLPLVEESDDLLPLVDENEDLLPLIDDNEDELLPLVDDYENEAKENEAKSSVSSEITPANEEDMSLEEILSKFPIDEVRKSLLNLENISRIITMLDVYASFTEDEKYFLLTLIYADKISIDDRPQIINKILLISDEQKETIKNLSIFKELEPVERAFKLIELDEESLFNLSDLVHSMSDKKVPTNITRMNLSRELVKLIEMLNPELSHYISQANKILSI